MGGRFIHLEHLIYLIGFDYRNLEMIRKISEINNELTVNYISQWLEQVPPGKFYY